MAHRTASKPILSLRSLPEVCGKDFFNNGSAAAQWPVSASFAPRSAIEGESAVVAAFLAVWALVLAARKEVRAIKVVVMIILPMAKNTSKREEETHPEQIGNLGLVH